MNELFIKIGWIKISGPGQNAIVLLPFISLDVFGRGGDGSCGFGHRNQRIRLMH